MKISETEKYKVFISDRYNYVFDKTTGMFIRWGVNEHDDPQFSPYGPELVDMEIVVGDCLGKCAFCYKNNGSGKPKYMTFETFKTIFDKLPKTVTQIAFGITNIDSNPDFFRIMEYTRENGVIPNYTTHGLDITEEHARKTAEICGSVGISVVNKNKTLESIDMFHSAGVKQINIHYVLSEETYEGALQLIEDLKEYNNKVFAILFLALKKKGRGVTFHPLSDKSRYKEIYHKCIENKIGAAFDSCTAGDFLKAIQDEENFLEVSKYIESCESYGLFSSYINWEGKYFPCSFVESEKDWEDGIDVLHCNDFLKDVWYSDIVSTYRKQSIATTKECTIDGVKDCRRCLHFNELNPWR